ncbi:MAG: MoaD/ThiS family protein [Rubrivivax sp.]|nr:MoaD/ThiS family protein [Rubrivivax sp.]
MPRITFTPQLRRFVEAPEFDSAGAGTLLALLDEAFVRNPRLRGYIVDDQGHLRPNVVVFIDGRRSTERVRLEEEALAPGSQVHVLQALSGG